MSEKKLNVKFWEVSNLKDFEYPEVSDPALKYQPIIDRLKNYSCGIAFSGGGTVSAALAPGFIKALEEIGVMENVSYISGVSGGTWGTAAYCYALNSEMREKYYGGIITDPTNLSYDDASQNPPEGSMVLATTKAEITLLGLKDILDGDGDYTETVGKIFLKPFGLDTNNKKYFTSDEKALSNILERNPNLSKDDFYVLYQKLLGDPNAKPTSPYYIMNASMFTPPASKEITQYQTYPFEFTPLYSGMKGTQDPSAEEVIGGAYIETFGFNSKGPDVKGTNDAVGYVLADRPEKVFDLSSPVGTSGSAIEKLVAKYLPSFINPLLKLLPAFNYWNPKSKSMGTTHQYLYGDGGITENTGVSPLLRRHIKNIVLFVTEPLDVATLSNRKCEREQRLFGHNQMAGLFGAAKLQYDKKTKTYIPVSDDDSPYQFFYETDFQPLADELNAAKAAGGPITVTKTHKVKENLRFGVEGGWDVNITWVIVDSCLDFNKSLDKSLFHKEEDGKGNVVDGFFVPEELNNFPAICTFLQNAKLDNILNAHLIQLTNAQANLLASQAYWMVKNSDEVKKALGGS